MLRHTAATLAIRGGATVKTVQAMLGHASAAMTLDVYASCFPDDLDRAAEAVAAAPTSCALSVLFWPFVASMAGGCPGMSAYHGKVGGVGQGWFLGMTGGLL